ncbi:MAG: DUF5103 domain-containing protein [Bacteroidota bacterium]|nr:DUF5103 domain-containing protein [Bacteroidota bacterium]
MIKSVFTLILLHISILTLGQDDIYNNSDFKYDNYIYNDNIYSAQIHKKGFPLSMAILDINNLNKNLLLSFDDFNDDVIDYYYTLIHCNANWEPSNLQKNEYILGFDEGYIEEYKFSYNTIQPFIHYSLEFPQEEHMPTKSGNYIIKVYPSNHPDKAILSARFMIYNPQIIIDADIKKATSVKKRDKMQEVDFVLNTKHIYISNPMQEIKVTIVQNNRRDNIITNIKPMNIRGDILKYDYEEENLFMGGNEFRHFDMKSFRYQSDRVKKIDVFSSQNHIYLYTDEIKTYSPYIFENDINGRRLIKTSDYENTSTEADYAWVHFRIPYPAPLLDGEIYILGELTNWQLDKKSRMTYNYEHKAYEDSIYLKQGYYNYLYAFLEDGKKEGDLTLLENSFSETENSYTIFVYFRQQGGLYDKLIGVESFSSVIK